MKKWGIIVGVTCCLAASGVALFYLFSSTKLEDAPDLPDEVSVTPTNTSTIPPTATFPSTPSPTATASTTPSPTATATLATRIAALVLVMPNVTLPPSATPLPENLQILSEAPDPVEPLPNATLLPSLYNDFAGWVSFESDHPAMRYTQGSWTRMGSLQASEGQYHFTEDTDARLAFTFNGEAVRVCYVGFSNGGVWNVVIDGMIVDVIDSYAPTGMFTGTTVYTLSAGEHTLELQNTSTTNPSSTGHMLALDAVQVYRPDALTIIVPGGVLPTTIPTATLVPAHQTSLMAAPPSPQPTASEIPIQIVSAALVIGYDENANGVLDVSEGVRGISVRLVETGTNHVLAHGFTDEQGFIQLEASTNAAVQLVVPYFGESWSVQSHSGGQQSLTLLLSPGNQPGLIP